MTVAAITTQTTYALAGTALGPFSTVWPYANASDVTVQIDYGEGAGPQLLVQGVDYVLTANNPTLSNGGSVTLAAYILSNFGAAWGPGAEIILGRVTPRSQPSAFGEAVGFSPRGSEQALDNVERQVQEIGSRADRALVVPAPELGGTLPPAAERAGMYLGFDLNGQPVMLTGTGGGGGGGGAIVVSNMLPSIAALRAQTKIAVPWAWVACYATMGDGGGGLFLWDPGTSAADDGGIIFVDQAGRRWRRAYNGRATAAMFGAVSDWRSVPGQGTDNAPALQSMLDKLGYIYGSGLYRVCSGLTCSNDVVSVEGTQFCELELVFDGPVAVGLTLGNATRNIDTSTVIVRNVRIRTTQAHAGQALVIQHFGDGNWNRYNIKAWVESVEISGDDITTQGWNGGIAFNECINVNIINCGFVGQGNQSYPNDTEAMNTQSNTAISFVGNQVPCAYNIIGGFFYSWEHAINMGGDSQGLTVGPGTQLVNVGVGVYAEYSGTGGNYGQQQLCITDCSFNTYQAAIYAYGVVNLYVHDNDIFHNPQAVSAVPLIDCTDCQGGFIHHNQLIGYAGQSPCDAIVLETGNQNISISDNIFQSSNNNGGWGFNRGVWIKSGGAFGNNQYNKIQGANQFIGTFNTKPIQNDLNAGSGGDYNVVGHPSALVSKLEPINYPSGSGANAVFDNILHDSSGFYVGPSSLVIPAGSGISRVRLSGGGNWDANAAGLRQIEIRKNSSANYPGVGCITAASSGAATAQEQSVATGIIPVVAGDSFTLVTLQTSGVALNFNNAWIGIEAIE